MCEFTRRLSYQAALAGKRLIVAHRARLATLPKAERPVATETNAVELAVPGGSGPEAESSAPPFPEASQPKAGLEPRQIDRWLATCQDPADGHLRHRLGSRRPRLSRWRYRCDLNRENAMKYLCLAYEAQADLDALSRTEWEALRKETLDYVEALRESGRLLATNALQSASTAVTVRVRTGRLSITDGPFAEAKEHIGGYFVIEAASLEEAVAIASRWPSARIGSIEVRPIEDSLSEERRYAAHRSP